MIRFVVFLVLHISVISFCPSYIEKKFDRVISNLELMIKSLETNSFESEDYHKYDFFSSDYTEIITAPPTGVPLETKEPSEDDNHEAQIDFKLCVPIRMQNFCPFDYILKNTFVDYFGRQNHVCCK